MPGYETLIPIAGAITTIGGAYLTMRQIVKNANKDKELEKHKILQEAKDDVLMVKNKLESRIESLKAELKHLEANVEREFLHVRETYNSEIRNLGEKIEELRTELREQHKQMVALLTKMVESRKD